MLRGAVLRGGEGVAGRGGSTKAKNLYYVCEEKMKTAFPNKVELLSVSFALNLWGTTRLSSCEFFDF